MKSMLKTTLVLATLVVGALALPALADDDDDIPPPEVLATLTPVYFEGHAAYWWHNRWHYRDEHQHWNFYRTEPGNLHDWRNSHQQTWHYYGGGGGNHGGGGGHRR